MAEESDELWSLQELIHSVCRTPRMFAAHGSFEVCAAFIHGYATGRGRAMREELDAFRYWLALRAYHADGCPRNYVWDAYIQRLYPDDATLFAQLPGLYDEFLTSAPDPEPDSEE